jgi:3,4-dihydroxy 2-butanone 4-phosphate synthase/GTP cyclohydrolase II
MGQTTIQQVERMVTSRVPTPNGEFKLSLYHGGNDNKEHLALVKGEVDGCEEVLVRVHSECFTGDVLGSERCDCGDQLRLALEAIDREGRGVLLYLRQEGRGIGLLEKLKAYNLQDQGYDTVTANHFLGHAADARDYRLAAWILEDLSVASIRLLTNNPAKIEGLEKHGVRISNRIPMRARVTKENSSYLRTKVEQMQHLLDLDSLVPEDRLRPRPMRYLESQPATQHGMAARPIVEELRARLQEERPFPLVTLSYAQSVDGCIAHQDRGPVALSGPESLVLTHKLRAEHDAILVGIGTILADNPRLTVRLVDAQDPQPVVLDSQLRFPLDALMLKGSYPWIATSEDADPVRQARLEAAGARVFRLPRTSSGQLSLVHLLQELKKQGIHSLMVEGGACVITNFLRSRLIDYLVLTIAPTMVGGLRAVDLDRGGSPPSLPRLLAPKYQQLGTDLILWGEPEWPRAEEP